MQRDHIAKRNLAEDLELVYWATGLMHEFVLKGKKRFAFEQ